MMKHGNLPVILEGGDGVVKKVKVLDEKGAEVTEENQKVGDILIQ